MTDTEEAIETVKILSLKAALEGKPRLVAHLELIKNNLIKLHKIETLIHLEECLSL